MNELHDFLIRAREPATLARVSKFIADDPGFTLLRQLGPSDAPHTLVVATDEQGAALLRQRFGADLIVEPDRPLNLF